VPGVRVQYTRYAVALAATHKMHDFELRSRSNFAIRPSPTPHNRAIELDSYLLTFDAKECKQPRNARTFGDRARFAVHNNLHRINRGAR